MASVERVAFLVSKMGLLFYSKSPYQKLFKFACTLRKCQKWRASPAQNRKITRCLKVNLRCEGFNWNPEILSFSKGILNRNQSKWLVESIEVDWSNQSKWLVESIEPDRSQSKWLIKRLKSIEPNRRFTFFSNFDWFWLFDRSLRLSSINSTDHFDWVRLSSIDSIDNRFDWQSNSIVFDWHRPANLWKFKTWRLYFFSPKNLEIQAKTVRFLFLINFSPKTPKHLQKVTSFPASFLIRHHPPSTISIKTQIVGIKTWLWEYYSKLSP